MERISDKITYLFLAVLVWILIGTISYYAVKEITKEVVSRSCVIEEVDKEITNGKVKKYYYLYTTDDFCISNGDVNYTSPDYTLSAITDLKIYLIFLDSSEKPISNRYDITENQLWFHGNLCLPFTTSLPSDKVKKVKYARFLFYSGKKLIGTLTAPVCKTE